MKVTIVGCGHVGLVTGAALAETGHTVVGYDSDHAKLAVLREGRTPFYEPGLDELIASHHGDRLTFSTDVKHAIGDADVAFICVGTPARPDGRLSLAYVEQAARDIAETATGPIVIVEKSTVPVRTAQRIIDVLKDEKKHPQIEVVTNPEFLREGSAVRDMLSPDRIVVGLEGEGRAEQVMRDLYQPTVDRSGCQLIFTDLETAELIKHASNSFLALKLSYINAVARLCEKVGADVELVVKGMSLDPRIGPHHLHPGAGYGGSCFPKDVAAFIQQGEDLGVDLSLLEYVRRINGEQRELVVAKVKRAVWNLEDKTIAVWGLAFKPDTDDLREAPAVDVVRALELEGAKVRAYDPAAGAAAKNLLPATEIASDAMAAVEGADALIVMTEWPEFVGADLEKVRSALRRPVIIDGRNIWGLQQMADLGFTYLSFGRPEVVSGRIERG